MDHSEHGHVIFTDDRGHERYDCAMLDPGASAFLSGCGPFMRYVLKLKETGYNITEIKFMRCQRMFFFGGDASLACSWTVRLPLCVGGKHGYVQMYLLPGETPMLLGRPIMEALGLVLDCPERIFNFDDMPWQEAVVGAHGEYLLSLLNEFDSDMWQYPPSFELLVWMVASMVTLWTSRSSTKRSSSSTTPQWSKLQPKMNFALCSDTCCRLAMSSSTPWRTSSTPTSLRSCTNNPRSECSGKFTVVLHGFLNLQNPRAWTLRSSRLRTEMPDEVYLASTCGPWSQMQNLNAKTEAQQYELYLKRKSIMNAT